MSISLETNDQSFLTDEVLEEELEYKLLRRSDPSQHHLYRHQDRQEEDEEEQLQLQQHLHNVEHGNNNEDFNDMAHDPLIRANYDIRHHMLQDDNHHTLPETTSEEGGELNQKLCWRSDPSQSLSDWELHIFNRSTKTFQIYHVHRVVMALGPRGCEFFQDVFRQAEAGTSPTSASLNKTSRVPLIAESCKMVGCFLDYVYGNEQFEITSENALGMCYLADYFRNNSLWELATDFIEEDLGTESGREHLCQYYTDSIYYDQDEFLDHILTVCSRDVLGMMEDGIPCTKLLGELTPAHFLKILVDMEPPTDEKLSSSVLLTRLITEFCCMHRNELAMERFENFTRKITLLDSSSAITLLETSLEYDFGSYKANDRKQNNVSRDSLSSLISFQQQCIETLSEEWEELLELDQSRVTRIMRILSQREEHQGILVDWFHKTLQRASKHLMTSRQETERAQQQKLLMEDRYTEMTEKLEVAQEQTAISQRNHKGTKSEMKTQISSWMRKNEGTNQRRQVEQQQWEHERLRWQMECQQWKHEKSKLKRELKSLRHKLSPRSTNHTEYCDEDTRYSSVNYENDHRRKTTSPGQDKPFVIPNDCDSYDDSRSFVSESSLEDNSLLYATDDFPTRDPHGYPLNNGMSPQFRIL